MNLIAKRTSYPTTWTVRNVIMKAVSSPKEASMSVDMVQRITRKVPYQEGFRFSRGIGDYTGQVATSLEDMQRCFEPWILSQLIFTWNGAISRSGCWASSA